jgi:hypothetical protein
MEFMGILSCHVACTTMNVNSSTLVQRCTHLKKNGTKRRAILVYSNADDPAFSSSAERSICSPSMQFASPAFTICHRDQAEDQADGVTVQAVLHTPVKWHGSRPAPG